MVSPGVITTGFQDSFHILLLIENVQKCIHESLTFVVSAVGLCNLGAQSTSVLNQNCRS